MNALIIVAHGSRNKKSAQQVAALCQKVSGKAQNLSDKNKSDQNKFDIVTHAFLQFASPSLEETIEDLVQRGAGRIIVFPFFIAAGSHLLKDIPELIERADKAYPGVDFAITRHLGGIDAIEDLIIKEV
ncbi:MAG: cobalamin biosynthesis protein CbiX, partial [Desulfobacteraceae bacterium]|nr:cobalamin biosynthesis protein CbiX [Desulfobacteraceae bacterium]